METVNHTRVCDLIKLHEIVCKYIEDCKSTLEDEVPVITKMLDELNLSTIPYGIDECIDYLDHECEKTISLNYRDFKDRMDKIEQFREEDQNIQLYSDCMLTQLDHIILSYNDLIKKPIIRFFGKAKKTQATNNDQKEIELIEEYLKILRIYFDQKLVDLFYSKSCIEIQKTVAKKTDKKVESLEDEHTNAISTNINFQDFSRVNMNQRYKYEKKCHFKDTVNQFQGVQHKFIPESVFEDVRKMIKTHGLLSNDETNPYSLVKKQHIRIFLEETDNAKYYEDFQLIYSKITGIPCPNISKYEKQLYDDFDQLVEAFFKLNLDRKNFLSNHYILRQLLKKQRVKVADDDLNTLRTPNRLREHDDIYQQCCEILGWNFSPMS